MIAFPHFDRRKRRKRLAKKVVRADEIRRYKHRDARTVTTQLSQIRARRGARGLPPSSKGARVVVLYMPALQRTSNHAWSVGRIVSMSPHRAVVDLGRRGLLDASRYELDYLTPWLADHFVMGDSLWKRASGA